MGQLINLEHIRLIQQEKLRTEALKRFPWQEMERMCRDYLEPMVRFWSEQKQYMVLELVYRLVFEVYVYGIREAKKAKAQRRYLIDQHTWDDVYHHFYQEECQKIVQETTHDFALFQWLDEWRCESVFILLENLARIWFIRGVQG